MDHNLEFVFPLIAYIREKMVDEFGGELTYKNIEVFCKELNDTIKAADTDLMLYDGTLYVKSWEPKKG